MSLIASMNLVTTYLWQSQSQIWRKEGSDDLCYDTGTLNSN